MKRVAIVGTGSYLPETIMTNFDIEKFLDTSDEWIYTRTGIKTRRIADKDWAVSDLSKIACERAMDMAGLKADDIDLIILATITPDTHCPAGANWLEAKLGCTKAVSFDITAACSGFIFALHVADKMIKSGANNTVLVIGAEIMTRVVNWKERESCVLWGDGAGAAVVTASDSGAQVLSTHVHTDGKNGDTLLMPGGGSKTTPISYESVDRGLHFLKMIEANRSFKVAVNRFAEAVEEAVEINGKKVSDVDVIIPHQANLRIIQGMAKRLKVDIGKVYMTIEKYGNISSATVPIALDEAVRDGTIKKDSLVCLTAFGGGLTWGSSLIKW
ncbi:MAG TPA: beta-ketoacyl-ACP synthase III [Syntrophorhabdus sp.]|jgi:3-oxoacyl-[acyl-carrier-protein] synthase-3|nr:ketoacyl-ACP synthase III [Syntrophorhabdus sp.]MDI9557757.1 beta-ketoacyl-ACP synthase III [Pseudomonadota bacterium]HNS79700.1 beta-ketoacyl-ACP synthase III [Syntrophorhabdus sp.]HPB38338.1 beta-ketoacyl-ACP synthase III [Syntrophorhabdus sp.]HPW36313.1 beta-ketoacyl-ACP synthase III [Syntrophorhabdus sp.]